MNKLLLLLFSILISFSSYGEVELDFSSDTFCDQSPKAQVRNGLFYLPNQQKPYSGENLCVYLSNGQYYSQGVIKKGLRTGEWTYWKENGQKHQEKHYKNGEFDGKFSAWWSDGSKHYVENYKDGKLDGKQENWYENGQIQYEGYFKDGKYQGTQTYWYKTGQIKSESIYKDGKLDSIRTELSEDELFAKGEAIYNANCSGCHQKDGSGIPGVFPAMSDSIIANGPAADHLNIVFNGKGGMPAFKLLGDLDLASVITYERRAFGNNGSVVQPSDVWLVRKRVEAETN